MNTPVIVAIKEINKRCAFNIANVVRIREGNTGTTIECVDGESHWTSLSFDEVMSLIRKETRKSGIFAGEGIGDDRDES